MSIAESAVGLWRLGCLVFLMAGMGAVGPGCDEGQAVMLPAEVRGRALVHDPDFSGSEFNVFACTTCHTTTAADDGAVASTLFGVVDRESWWGGSKASLSEAVDFCYVYFMRGFPGLDRASDDGRALYEYLLSLSSGAALPTRPMTVVEAVYDPGDRGDRGEPGDRPAIVGDAAAGAEVYERACAVCHGEKSTGIGRLGSNVAVIPEASEEFARDNNVPLRLVLAEKVRHGQFFGVGGNMPLYPLERMSDEELADLLEYLAP